MHVIVFNRKVKYIIPFPHLRYRHIMHVIKYQKIIDVIKSICTAVPATNYYLHINSGVCRTLYCGELWLLNISQSRMCDTPRPASLISFCKVWDHLSSLWWQRGPAGARQRMNDEPPEVSLKCGMYKRGERRSV